MKTVQIRIAPPTDAERNCIGYLTPEERRDALVGAGQAKLQRDSMLASLAGVERRKEWAPLMK